MLARMGLLDDVLWNLGPEVPTLAGRRAARVLRKGESSEATIVGILVERTADENRVEPEYRYALDVRTSFGTSRVGVRQRLGGGVGQLAGVIELTVAGAAARRSRRKKASRHQASAPFARGERELDRFR